MTACLGVILAGALGAPLRYLVDSRVQLARRRTFPVGTLVVNVSGSLVLGLVTGLALYHGLPRVPKAVLGAGFCGAYTTFSTHAFETVRLAEEGVRRSALVNVLANLLLGTAAAAAGLALAGVL
jgi:CrcB protein